MPFEPTAVLGPKNINPFSGPVILATQQASPLDPAMKDQPHFQHGFHQSMCGQAAVLYDQAFGQKLALAIPSQEKRLKILQTGLDPRHSFVALKDGLIVGIAGYKSTEGSLTGAISFEKLRNVLGILGAIRAAMILVAYDRPLKKDQLLMDGISVSDSQRGNGVGSALLQLIKNHARETGLSSVRLDVIDTNPAARRLYERHGFREVAHMNLGVLSKIFGFSGATTMELQVGGGS